LMMKEKRLPLTVQNCRSWYGKENCKKLNVKV
jgi:hypothetical protein